MGTISEPGGSFHMDNFTSNEPEVGRLSTLLRETGHAGGVYMSVATLPLAATSVFIRPYGYRQYGGNEQRVQHRLSDHALMSIPVRGLARGRSYRQVIAYFTSVWGSFTVLTVHQTALRENARGVTSRGKRTWPT
jgi:hypothetical protein